MATVVLNAVGQFLSCDGLWVNEYPEARTFESIGSACHAAREKARRTQAPTWVYCNYGLSTERVFRSYQNDIDKKHATARPIPAQKAAR